MRKENSPAEILKRRIEALETAAGKFAELGLQLAEDIEGLSVRLDGLDGRVNDFETAAGRQVEDLRADLGREIGDIRAGIEALDRAIVALG